MLWVLALLALWFWANRRWFAKLERKQREER